MIVLGVFLLGGLGVLVRFGLDSWWASSPSTDFPMSTFLANIIGCALAALISILGVKQLISVPVQTALLVGFCGGLTTFSAYTIQTASLFENHRWSLATLYLFLSPAVGLITISFVFWMTRRLF